MMALQQKMESVSYRSSCGDLFFGDNYHLQGKQDKMQARKETEAKEKEAKVAIEKAKEARV